MLVNNSNLTTIWVEENDQKIKIIDQRLLPHELSIVTLNTVKDVEFAIREMQVRGAPLIGGTAAFGVAMAMKLNNIFTGVRVGGLKKNHHARIYNPFIA